MPLFQLGEHSLAEISGVHPDLARVVCLAITLTPVDFSVIDGLRTLDEQRAFVAKGASQTLKSRHLSGHAVDLAPYVGNKLRWELALLCQVAGAMREAAHQCRVPLRWGGNWGVLLTDTALSPDDLLQDYIAKRLAAGQRPFVDAPHFELPVAQYP